MPNKKQHLSYEERFCIEKMLKMDSSLLVIGHTLGRALSTISQEINENGGKKSYIALKAQNRSQQKQNKKKQAYNKIARSKDLVRFVRRQLKKGLSPESMADLLVKQRKLEYVSSKSIRKYIKQIFGLKENL